MLKVSEIMKISNGEEVAGLQLVMGKEQTIPNAIQYSIKRFEKSPDLSFEEIGLMVYSYSPRKTKESYLQLKFCVAGSMYCSDQDCSHCTIGNFKNCTDSADSIELIQINFSAAQLLQFNKTKAANIVSDDVLNFRHRTSFSRTLPVCSKIKSIVGGLVNHKYSGSLENIYVNAQLHMLLLFSLDCLAFDSSPVFPECKFLNNPADRSKLAEAREILIQNLGDPITIRELSRKVAMNECYLKKGFKEMYGTTIFDFYQNQRMEHAKDLLYEKGMSVTDVSMMLGYSSISHFSTAFKKQTGLKPCELLLR